MASSSFLFTSITLLRPFCFILDVSIALTAEVFHVSFLISVPDLHRHSLSISPPDHLRNLLSHTGQIAQICRRWRGVI